LIPDTEKDILKAYGIWGPKKLYGREYDGIHRTTFVIDEQGVIEKVFTKVKTKEHAEQILAEYE
jgi:peroxiredoxin Q/BCP